MIGDQRLKYSAGRSWYTEQVTDKAGSTTGNRNHELPIRCIDLFDELPVQCVQLLWCPSDNAVILS